MTNSSFIGIDLFAGAGGLSLGLSNAGFDMKIGIEIEKYSANTLQKNCPHQKVITENIRSLNPLTVLKKNGLRPTEIDLIAGGPPCQGFSKSNMRSRTVGNPLNDMYLEYFKFVKAIKPEIFLFENVAGLTLLPYGERYQEILKLGKKLNYKIQAEIIDSQNYGVPRGLTLRRFYNELNSISVYPKNHPIAVFCSLFGSNGRSHLRSAFQKRLLAYILKR
jgi:DNA (cytosine-5)-methyltransferase 1